MKQRGTDWIVYIQNTTLEGPPDGPGWEPMGAFFDPKAADYDSADYETGAVVIAWRKPITDVPEPTA